MTKEQSRQLNFLAGCPVGTTTMTEADLKTVLMETGGNMLAIYYYGRLEKFSAKQLEDAILKESLSVKPEDFLADSSRCGKILMEKGHAISQISDDLVRRGQESQQKKPAAPSVAPPAVPQSDDKQSHDK